jgi:Family of unknown function (DUF6152)
MSAPAFILLLLVGSATLVAHHSFSAEFDIDKAFKMTGTVTKVEWTNPHTFFYVDVLDERTKELTNWGMELGSPNNLIRGGWNRNSLKIGDVVVVEGSLRRDGRPIGSPRTVYLEKTGQRLFAPSGAVP